MRKFSGLEYIKIAIANAYGLDNKTWDERLNWVEGSVKNTFKNLNNYGLLKDAKEPILMFKALNAYIDALAGKPTQFIMGLDATQSGPQIMAALTGCKRTAINTNLIYTCHRMDAYGVISEVMNKEHNTNVSRDDVKMPTMTTLYNSTAKPKEVFGDGTPELEAFYKTMYKELPGCMEFLSDVQRCWQPKALKHSWTLPNGSRAVCKIMRPVDKKIEVEELNKATFTHRMLINTSDAYGLSLPANIVQSIDGYIVDEMARLAKLQEFGMLHIFDSFWASPNYMNNVRQNYINTVANIADSNLLESILNEITGSNGKYTKLSTDLGDLIRKSEYMLS